ncbi:MAG: rod shape-determining protein MreC [Blastocatellia bacterium]|jgi:rod shape-determining protein MreC|nr:rod shape-determining protein MreC [Blastocatellia bacterium]MDX6306435.1 rod shape-determining protein MreC [Blastocatellia bacterium]
MAAIRTQREIRQRAPWWLFGLLLLNFALMTYDARDDVTKQRKVRSIASTITYPIQQGASSVGNWIGGFFGNIGELRRASTENQQLHQQIDQMQTELRGTRERAAEAERLEKLFKLNETSAYQTVVARVIARDPSMWFDSVTIDKGRWAGVEVNMPVVTPGGIVGRVISTSPLSAQVMLVTDEKSGAGAIVGQLGQSTAMGSVKGLGENGLLEMRYVSGMEKVQVGDTVTTTGQDAIYPQGYTVGEVVEVKPGSATQAQVIRIRPGAGLERLKEVAVLMYHPPPRTESDQSLPNVEKKPVRQ